MAFSNQSLTAPSVLQLWVPWNFKYSREPRNTFSKPVTCNKDVHFGTDSSNTLKKKVPKLISRQHLEATYSWVTGDNFLKTSWGFVTVTFRIGLWLVIFLNRFVDPSWITAIWVTAYQKCPFDKISTVPFLIIFTTVT